MSDIVEAFLSKPVGADLSAVRGLDGPGHSKPVNGSAERLTGTLTGTYGEMSEGAALKLLEDNGLDPKKWVVKKADLSSWGKEDDMRVSGKFSFERKAGADRPEIDIDALVDRIVDDAPSKPIVRTGRDVRGAVIAIGDMQFGKCDGDSVEGTLRRTLSCIDVAAARIRDYRRYYDIEHVHVAWLGDHIEGFVSQGGANVWRTHLTLSEQIRMTRRVMLHALRAFAPLSNKLTMAAVPGNHGEPQRFSGKGITRYDDSHDTECLVAVADAVDLNREAYPEEKVSFYVPETDEMTVTLDVCGTQISHVHGHQFRPGKHFDWWEGQAFGGSSLRDSRVLLAGHLHHYHVDTSGPRMFIQVPALESESTWWRHSTGAYGDPGVVLLLTGNGRTDIQEVVRGG